MRNIKPFLETGLTALKVNYRSLFLKLEKLVQPKSPFAQDSKRNVIMTRVL